MWIAHQGGGPSPCPRTSMRQRTPPSRFETLRSHKTCTTIRSTTTPVTGEPARRVICAGQQHPHSPQVRWPFGRFGRLTEASHRAAHQASEDSPARSVVPSAADPTSDLGEARPRYSPRKAGSVKRKISAVRSSPAAPPGRSNNRRCACPLTLCSVAARRRREPRRYRCERRRRRPSRRGQAGVRRRRCPLP